MRDLTRILLLCIFSHLAAARAHNTPLPHPESQKEEPRGYKLSQVGRHWKKGRPTSALDTDREDATEWTSWFNVDHPGGEGDFESLEAIRFYYRERVCPRPLALEARTTEWELPWDVGERVHSSPSKGFWCLNQEQAEGKTCSNYHIRFKCPLEATWSEWGAWGPCSKSCGGGRRLRRRTCSISNKKSACVGHPTEAQKCIQRPCSGCQLRCATGVPSEDCSTCVCEGHTILGTILTPAGVALPEARVTLKGRPRAVLATSDHRGSFRVSGVCSDSRANISVQLEGFSPGTAQIVSNGSTVASVKVILRRVERPYLVKHPESKVREAGQHVTLCCKALGTPVPKKYYWYHNGSLLDRAAHKYDSSLILRDLEPQQAGTYHCKASSDAGAIRSSDAFLTVVGKGQPACDPRPQEHLIKLPKDCPQAATGSHYYNVGRCPDSKCPGKQESSPQCRDSSDRCCAVRRMELREIQCPGYVLPIKAVVECGCEKCPVPKILVRGRVTAADTGEPLRFAQVFLGKEKIGFTGYQGTFTIEVPPDTERLVVQFIDPLQRFVDTVKVFPFDQRGGAVYQEVKVMRKKAPVTLDATQLNRIPLGEVEGAELMGEVVIPPLSFRRANGEVYRGPVRASLTFLDPRDLLTAAAASSDLSFVDADGEAAPLRTYGMFSVDLRAEGSNEVLQTGRVEVRVDAGQIQMPEHAQTMKLWSLNPETGFWEEESDFRQAPRARGKREERTFLVGNLEIRERRLFNLDVPEPRRCFVKVRAYINDKFVPNEQLEGVVVSLINLEPMAGFSANPRAWGRFDSAITGPNGACLPAFCDSQQADAYTAYVTAALGGEELEPAASSPRPNPSTVGVSQPYLGKLQYRRTDHDDPNLKRNGFRINLPKPNPNNLDEINGPLYPYSGLRECEEAPVSANHFRFSRVEADKFEYNVVPFREGDLTSWSRDYLSWWPNPQEFRACFIKVKIQGPQEYMVRSRNVGGSHPQTRGQLYGLRDTRSVRDPERSNTSAACVEFKCSGMLFDQSLVDRTLVSLIPQGSCRRTAVNGLLREYLSRHPPGPADTDDLSAFDMLAPVDPLGHNYGIYTVTDQNPRLAKEIAIGRCFDGTSDGFSREMKADVGTAVTFHCQERPSGRQSLFRRLLTSPADTLAEIRREMSGREMGGNEQRRGPARAVAFPVALRNPLPSQTRRTPGGRRRVEALRARQ
ncbi:LOW QUALITY PROTEIN: cartilage intermediate layer protein 2 [Tachyglossus aculeatus]|uniref:LOW QUALITY PROTEIN: cartilage intermediate layer protein 2 n=1 Tax=Tachyglossus aculeatus TaxID=9261 RepID=UPI0018F368EC|nr:LOW QUALITY PROTEIN: cartilage intermediate layer protein 2 [Tachyglossus aculeatus]